MIFIPQKNKKNKSRMYAIASAAFASAAIVADVAYGAGTGAVDSTVEINDSTLNGPVLSDYDFFGWSVANIGDLNGDGVNDLVVGANGDDEGGTGRGAIHIMFMNTDGTVDSTVEINDTTTNGPVLSNDDLFGGSVANIGDLNNDGVSDLAVGAYFDDEGGTNRGAVHIMFMNTDGTVDSTVEINDSTANGPVLADSERFGRSIANIGDLNNDGVLDLAVGANRDYEGVSSLGAIHIMFMNTDGTVDSTVEINDSTANGPVLNDVDRFGSSIANIGDLNNDGVNDLAVGAYFGDDEGGGYNRGTVHIMFMNTDGSVDSTVEINDSTANGPVLADSDAFGVSVANIGDLNNDGVLDLAVGARNDDEGGSARGAVHIMFMNTDGSVDSTVEINDSTTNGPVLVDYSYFGYSVANIGDLDGNGINDLAVGVWDNGDGDYKGAIHILFMYGTPAAAPTGGGGGHSSITASCNPSDRTVSVGDKVSFDIDIDTTEDSYTFEWTSVLEGTDEEETYTFNKAGKYYPRGIAEDTKDNKTIVNCGTITVEEGDDDTDNETNNEDTSSSNNNNPLYELVKKFQKELTLFQSIGISLPSTVQEILNSLNKTNNNTTTNTPTFTRDLELGMEGEDVKQLQIFLNNNGYTVSTQGPGSPNNETTRFGYATQSALINFQKANNITPALGYFGPVTRELVNGL